MPSDRETVFSPDRAYRYTLWRDVDMFNPRYVQFVGLNPSTADETQDDPTVRRMIDFTKRWGYGALCVTNLFAYRATDPYVMRDQAEPVGPDNDSWLRRIASDAALVVAAWGVHGSFRDRDRSAVALLGDTQCLGRTQDGAPRHPLYVRATTPLEVFSLAAVEPVIPARQDGGKW